MDAVFDAVKSGDVQLLRSILEENPAALEARTEPYRWTLLHVAAHAGHEQLVDELLRRGLDPDAREEGDNTYAMHWAAAAGHVDIVRRLADAGGDVIGAGDDHELGVIGWAAAWDGCDDSRHRAVAELLIERGASHNIWSAIAFQLADEVRRIVAADPGALSKQMSRNENFQLPLHFAVARNLPAMVRLLMDLGADPLGKDGSGHTAVACAATRDIDRPILERIRETHEADLTTLVGLSDWDSAEKWIRQHSSAIGDGTLHLMSKRGAVEAVRFLLQHGADPNAVWPHWDADVTPLHLAALFGHREVAEELLSAGADPAIRDTKHDGDAAGWAEHAGHAGLAAILRSDST